MAERFFTRVAAVASGSDKTLLTVFNPAATPTTRGRIYDLLIGSVDTPDDQAADFLLNRITAVGTEGSGLTPHNILGGPAGAYDSGLGAFSVEPTYTAGSVLFAAQLNQRATLRWVAPPGGEIVLAATQNNGAGLKTVTSTSTQDHGASLWFME